MTSRAWVLERIKLSTPTWSPIAEPSRVACSGCTMQGSGDAWSMALPVLSSTQMTSDLEWLGQRPRSPAMRSMA